MKQDFQTITGAKVGHFEKNTDLEYIYMCDYSAKQSGYMDGYDPALRITDYDLMWSKSIADGVREEDREVLATGNPSRSRSIVRTAMGWQLVIVYKTRTESGGIWGETVTVHPGDWASDWAGRLDIEKRRLNLPSGEYLTADDVTLLRMLLHDVPKKAMADMFCVSVKTVEKRQTIVTRKMRECAGDNRLSLRACVYELHMAQFLMAHHDWFSAEGVHLVQK